MVKISPEQRLLNNINLAVNSPEAGALIKRAARKLADKAAGCANDLLGGFRTNLIEEFRGPVLRDGKGMHTAFPEGTRFFQQNEASAYLVLEDAPQMHTITFYDKKYRLAFPYFYYFVSLSKSQPNPEARLHWYLENLCVALRNKPIEFYEDEVYRVPLPNISVFGVCLGQHDHAFNSSSLHKLLAKLKTYYWSSEFNHDMFENVTLMNQKKNFKDFDTWAAASAEDPFFVLKTNWGDGTKACDVRHTDDYDHMDELDNKDWVDRITQRALSAALQGISTSEIEGIMKAALSEILTSASQDAVLKTLTD